MITNKYVVVWRINEENFSEECKSLTDAEFLRWKLMYEKFLRYNQISIHLKQVNKFGDVVTVEEGAAVND